MVTLRDQTVCESILLRINFLEPNSMRRWGKMTAHEAVCHLTDSFLAVMGEKAVSPATGVLQKTVVKWFALHMPVPWPHGVPSRPEVAQGQGGTPPGEFERDRSALIKTMDRFRKAEEVLKTARHPIFGRMTFEEWQRWGYLHTDHHLRQFGA